VRRLEAAAARRAVAGAQSEAEGRCGHVVLGFQRSAPGSGLQAPARIRHSATPGHDGAMAGETAYPGPKPGDWGPGASHRLSSLS
jgi:hypothetical protein